MYLWTGAYIKILERKDLRSQNMDETTHFLSLAKAAGLPSVMLHPSKKKKFIMFKVYLQKS